ncbi:uncharacterized protein FIBRA_00041 [Fibroporia radiculosa]|uniref:Uncharacterized protein n=1 Tax=Fibroporia radiculosa TaxID=599839 RepID=J7RG15_9APHY|nr:uncharacterized protein FIBRA_00041 [Fibroporia radiculosa]CCL98047.1 predicted protein [Fibroporia radiculosa]
MSRGFSVHFLKSTPSSTHPYSSSRKSDSPQDRSNGSTWTKQSGYSSRPEFERKPSTTSTSAYRITEPVVYELPLEPKRSKTPKSYGIYPSASNDTYIYERSLSSASDALASSSSSSSSDADLQAEGVVPAPIDVSSTRASSSTETLETTALRVAYPTPQSRPVLPRSTSSSEWARITPDGSRVYPPGLPSRSENASLRAGVPTSMALLPRPSTVRPIYDDDDDDTLAEDEIDRPPPMTRRSSSSGARDESLRDARPTGFAGPTVRYSDERSGAQQVRARKNSDDYRYPLPLQYGTPSQYRPDNALNSRAPSGTSPPTSKMVDGRGPLGASGPPNFASSSTLPDGRRVVQAVPLTRTISGSRPVDIPSSTMGALARTGATKPKRSPPQSPTEPLTRTPSSRADTGGPLTRSNSTTSPEMLMVSTRRCVRWTEDLMCPCPVPRSERRRGWFNRRGDQLWTNDGKYKQPEPGTEYPGDLIGYPEPMTGWMNEEGVRIDMEHRLIPKPPIRSALKRPKGALGTQ